MLVQALKDKFWFAAHGHRQLWLWRGFCDILERLWMWFFAALKSKCAIHRIVPLRRRYFITRGNKVRVRYMVSCIAALFIALYGVVGEASSSKVFLQAAPDFKVAYAVLSPSSVVQEDDYEAAVHHPIDSVIQSGVSSGIRKASLAIQKPERPRYREFQVKPGDTVAELLQDAGLSGAEAYRAVKALGEYYDVRKIRSGQKIDVHFKSGENGNLEFTKMEMKLDAVKEVSVFREGLNSFKAELSEKELFPRVYARKAQIETSVYGSAARANIPSAIIAEMIRIYSWNIDFQRDIRSGDKVEVLYESFETEDGEFAKYGNILYANLSVGGRSYPIYRFEMDNGRVDFFDPDGTSIRKTLMKTPIDGARLSSGFGMRRHPVLGYNKMHKGTDFAASTGTPIYAAGDGVVEHAGRNGGYGNYVRIRHNSKLKTAYAHMHRIKVKKGMRVKQGQVIGSVGTTGRSTGPHLHYEVLVHNKQVNPRSVKLPTGEQLAGKELKRFKSVLGRTRQQYVSLSDGLKFASAEEETSSHNFH